MLLKKFGLAFLVLAFTVTAAQAAEWRERAVLNGAMTLMTPDDFGPMPFSLRPMQYPSIARPTDMLSDPTGAVTLTFDHTRAKNQNDINVLRKAMSGVYHKTYAGARWLRDEVTDVNGHSYAVFELVAPVNGVQVHHILYATQMRGTLLLIAFRAPETEAPHWLEAGRKMLASLNMR